MKRILLLSFLSLIGIVTFAASVNVGETIQLNCTASAPDGYITHAFFELADPNDAQYLAIGYRSSDCYAMLKGLKPKSNITINVTYAYTYSSYNNKKMVGHGTYSEKVTVVGGGPLTSIRFVPDEPTIKIGESVKVRIEVTPANTSTYYEWGVMDLYTNPSAYEITDMDNVSLTVTAKKAMNLILYAKSDNGKQTTAIIHATEDGKKAYAEPTAISFSSEKLSLVEGDKKKLIYTMEPDGATSKISWESSNEGVATVDDYGKVAAVSSGKATISATTANGKTANVEVEVMAAATDISLPESVEMYTNYEYQINPSLTPSNSAFSGTWKSSDTSVATVSSGKVRARKAGSTTITATLKNGNKATCTIRVSDPPSSLATYNVTTKIKQVKNLARRTFDNK